MQSAGQFGNVVCHGITNEIREGRKSFPSGHASWSFAGLGFLSFYLAGKLKAFDQKVNVAKICTVLLPLLVAALVCVSRVDDYWHHWQDVFAGGLLALVCVSRVDDCHSLRSGDNGSIGNKFMGNMECYKFKSMGEQSTQHEH
ncbi:hypothetical protein ACET3Z_030053 [Daucus carota]